MQRDATDLGASDLGGLGEFGLIDRFRALLGEAPEGEVWIGDDAAILRAPGGTILFTTDLLVAGVHFDLAWTSPEDVGYKAIAVSCSDIAAMGGTPRRAVVGLVIPRGVPGIDVSFLEGLYRGMRDCCDRFGLAVTGGDLSRGAELVVSVAMIGNPAGRRVIERRGARPGDKICVTGRLGAAEAGLRLLRTAARSGIRPGEAAVPGVASSSVPADLRAAHLRPVPRVAEVQVLRRYLPSAMIDVSDGFGADLGHLCVASGVQAWVDAAALPVIDLTWLALGPAPGVGSGLHGGGSGLHGGGSGLPGGGSALPGSGSGLPGSGSGLPGGGSALPGSGSGLPGSGSGLPGGGSGLPGSGSGLPESGSGLPGSGSGLPGGGSGLPGGGSGLPGGGSGLPGSGSGLPEAAQDDGDLALALALGGGEDYELCFTIAPDRAAAAAADVEAQTGTPVTVVGEVREGPPGVVLMHDGVSTQYVAPGWDHFR